MRKFFTLICRDLWGKGLLRNFLIIVLLGIPAFAQAFTNEPNGFGGLSWGQSLEELEDIAIFKKENFFKYGYRRDEEYNWWKVLELEKIVYCFYRNALFAIYMETKGFANAEILRIQLIEKYGPKTGSRRRFHLYWKGKVSEIVYNFDPVSEICRVVYISKEGLSQILPAERVKFVRYGQSKKSGN